MRLPVGELYSCSGRKASRALFQARRKTDPAGSPPFSPGKGRSPGFRPSALRCACRAPQASLHILRLADQPGYRRRIKAQANLQEGRHALARKIFHGRQGQLYQRYQDGRSGGASSG
jgi:hypothetical protein